MTIYAKTAQPARSPWGVVQDAVERAPGVWQVSTAGHGGVKLSPSRNKKVPAVARAAGGWYEEDADWAIAAYVHSDAYAPTDVTEARGSIGRYQTPEVFEALLGVPATAFNCDKQAEIEFQARHADDYQGMSAWGDHAAWVPDGMVGVFAGRGGRTPMGQFPEDQIYALVTKERYQGRVRTRGTYIIDPKVDQIINKPANLYEGKMRGVPQAEG